MQRMSQRATRSIGRANGRAARRAFTLLEVMMVLVILGVIAVLVLTQIGGASERAKIDAAGIAVKGPLSSALELFKANTGQYPSTDLGLGALIERPGDEEIAAKWSGPYLKAESLKDPWNSDYIYAFPGQVNETSFDLSSAGPDKVEGNDDDITNWTKT